MTTKRILHRQNHTHELPRAHEYDGIEFDLRIDAPDCLLGVGHDVSGVGFSRYLKNLLELGWGGKTLAINPKSMRVHEQVGELARSLLTKFDYFFFDVPGPEIPFWEATGLRWFGRISKYEKQESQHGALIDPYGEHPAQLGGLALGFRPRAVIAAGCHGKKGLYPLVAYDDYDYVIGKAEDLR